MDYIITLPQEDDSLIHYGVLGMKWGVRRTPVEQAAHRRYVGERKQEKIDKKKMKINARNEKQREIIRSGVKARNEIRAEQLSTQYKKDQIDRKLALDKHWTTFGTRRAQDKSFYMNARLKELDDMNLANETTIANAVRKLDINKKKISKLDKRYEKIGKKYLEEL